MGYGLRKDLENDDLQTDLHPGEHNKAAVALDDLDARVTVEHKTNLSQNKVLNDHEKRLDAAEPVIKSNASKVATHENRLDAHDNKLDSHSSSISDLKTRVSTLEDGSTAIGPSTDTTGGTGGGQGMSHDVPAGGKKGQALVKASDSDYDLTWASELSGGTASARDNTAVHVNTDLAATSWRKGDLVVIGTKTYVATKATDFDPASIDSPATAPVDTSYGTDMPTGTTSTDPTAATGSADDWLLIAVTSIPTTDPETAPQLKNRMRFVRVPSAQSSFVAGDVVRTDTVVWVATRDTKAQPEAPYDPNQPLAPVGGVRETGPSWTNELGPWNIDTVPGERYSAFEFTITVPPNRSDVYIGAGASTATSSAYQGKFWVREADGTLSEVPWAVSNYYQLPADADGHMRLLVRASEYPHSDGTPTVLRPDAWIYSLQLVTGGGSVFAQQNAWYREDWQATAGEATDGTSDWEQIGTVGDIGTLQFQVSDLITRVQQLEASTTP